MYRCLTVGAIYRFACFVAYCGVNPVTGHPTADPKLYITIHSLCNWLQAASFSILFLPNYLIALHRAVKAG